jgi:hypothetical protein
MYSNLWLASLVSELFELIDEVGKRKTCLAASSAPLGEEVDFLGPVLKVKNTSESPARFQQSVQQVRIRYLMGFPRSLLEQGPYVEVYAELAS